MHRSFLALGTMALLLSACTVSRSDRQAVELAAARAEEAARRAEIAAASANEASQRADEAARRLETAK